MARQTIDNGDTGATVRGKLNDNFVELYTGKDAVTVANFAALPDPTTVSGLRYWALAAQGVFLVNRKAAGAYYSDGLAWTWLGDNPTTAAQLGFVPAGLIAASNVQAALEELDNEKASVAGLTEYVQDVTGAMIAAAGGSYDDAAGTITLPSGSGLSQAQVLGRSMGC